MGQQKAEAAIGVATSTSYMLQQLTVCLSFWQHKQVDIVYVVFFTARGGR